MSCGSLSVPRYVLVVALAAASNAALGRGVIHAVTDIPNRRSPRRLAVVSDFNTCFERIKVDFNEALGVGSLVGGTVVDDTMTFPGGVTFKARRSNKIASDGPFNDAMIFDARRLDSSNTDLTFTRGFQNMLMIASESTDPQDPQDTEMGGEIVMEFSKAVYMKSIRVIDNENRNSGLTMFDEEGGRIRGVRILATRNGGSRAIIFTPVTNSALIKSMKIRLRGSGAIDNVNFYVPCNPTLSHSRLVRNFRDHRANAGDPVYSPDGSRIAAGGGFRPGGRYPVSIKIWDISGGGKAVVTIVRKGARLAPSRWAFSNDGTLLASAWSDGAVHVHDATVDNRNSLFSFQHSDNPNEEATVVAWSPDGSLIASGGLDETVKVWSVPDRRLLFTLTDHNDQAEFSFPRRIAALDFNHDGSRLLSAADADSNIIIWDTSTGSRRPFLPSTLPVGEGITNLYVHYSNDGGRIAVVHPGSDLIQIWDADSAFVIHSIDLGLDRSWFGVSWSPNDLLLAVSGPIDSGENSILVIREREGDVVLSINATQPIYSEVTWSPDGESLACSMGGSVLVWKVFLADGLLA